jgi:glyoxylase-like metal-dependent hydrolase (beta-lactamase superfamily II)/rhodanese-related sulfurtransferase
MYTEQFFVDGLGCASYLIGCESQGVAAVIDPDRDVQRYLDTAAGRGLKITHIIETHLHADHISGNTDLAQRTGADIYLHEAGGARFAHKTLKGGDTLWLGNVRLDVRHTPGHTPESISLLVSDTTRGPEPWMVMTGDTLFVGDIGRPDLVGAEAARGLAGDLYTSLFDNLLQLDDMVMVYPGHGAGSLCGRAIGSVRSTTVGFERRFNPALAPRARDEFITYATGELPEQPGNHQRIKSMNRQGPAPLGEPLARPLTIQNAIPYFQMGAALLDLRPRADFVKTHVPGSVHLEADDQLSNRAGFVLPPQVPVILLLADPSDYRGVVMSLARVGYDNIAGYLADSLDTWRALGLPLTSGDVKDIAPAELKKMLDMGNGERPLIIDVREPWEFRGGHLPGARLIPLGQLGAHLGELDPQQAVAVVCATGSRSQSAAALLNQKGFKTVYNVLGGTTGWIMSGLSLEREPA